jgi:hypothetical protein
MWRTHFCVQRRDFSRRPSGCTRLSESGVAISGDTARRSVAQARLRRAKALMKMEWIVAAVEVVARTGYGEAVGVFDLGPWAGKTIGMSW